MKKLLIIISILCIGIFSYAQLPSPTSHQTLNNGEQMGVFRGKLNTNGINIVNYLTLVKDTINDFSDRIKLLELGGSSSTGGSSSYTFLNGLTETLGNVSLGGVLSGSTTITTGLSNSLSINTASATPSSGVRSSFTVGGTQGFLSSYNYIASAISTGGSLVTHPTTGFNLSGRLGTKYSFFKHNSLGPLIESDLSSSGDYRTVNLTTAGFIYGADYSGNYTDRSLVDKAYVMGLFDGSVGSILNIDSLKFSWDGMSGNQLKMSGNSSGLTLQSFAGGSVPSTSYLNFDPKYGAFGKRFIDEHGIGILWGGDGSITLMSDNNGYSRMTFKGDSIHMYDANNYDWDYWIGPNMGGSFNGDTLSIKNLEVNDSIYYLGYGLPAGSLWYTNTSTGAMDTAHTEPAYIGWEMKDLPTLEEYEADVKMINGHMERRVWYIDYETKELKSQYGWSGLGMMNTQSAYMIYHEITVRWMFEQNRQARNQQRQIAGLVLLLIISLIVHAYMNRK